MRLESDVFGSFLLNESEFAISVDHIQEVVNAPESYAPVPLCPPYLKGLFNLRGVIIPVVDMGIILGLPSTAPTEGQKIVILEMGGYCVGLLFDGTGEIFRSQNEERSDFGKGQETVVIGVFKKANGKRLVQILDIEILFKLRNIPRPPDSALNKLKEGLSQKRGQKRQCISFSVGPAKCAVGISEIQEILKIEKIGEAGLAIDHCIGTIDLRGSILPVIDFASLLKYRASDRSEEATRGNRRVLVMRIENELFGLLVDSVESIVTYFSDEVLPFSQLNSERSGMVIGCIVGPQRPDILLLDPLRILRDEEVRAVTRGHSVLFRSTDREERERRARESVRRTYITFRVEQTFAVPIEQVKEIIEYPGALLVPPGMPAHIRGILNLRGDLVTIVDARLMYSTKTSQTPGGKVLIFKVKDLHFGLVVDSVQEIVSFIEKDKLKLPELLYKDSSGGLVRDVSEAVEYDLGGGKKHSLLIVNADSIAERLKAS